MAHLTVKKIKKKKRNTQTHPMTEISQSTMKLKLTGSAAKCTLKKTDKALSVILKYVAQII